MPSVAETYPYVIGVDTHARTHTYAIINATGTQIGDVGEFRATPGGYRAAQAWITTHIGDQSWLAAIEGTSSYGKQLTRHLREQHIDTAEVHPAPKATYRGRGKTDAIDAVTAARSVLASSVDELTAPRHSETRDVLQVYLTIRSQDTQERTSRINALNALIRTHGLRPDTRRKLTTTQIHALAAGDMEVSGHPAITAIAITLAARIVDLDTDLRANKRALHQIVTEVMPELVQQCGIGPVSAAYILCAWSHPGRFASEAHFASLAGVSPIPIGSGQSFTHRLNYGGDRRLNSAIHTIMLTRARCDDATKTYIARRLTEGKSPRAIQRILKRHIARQLFKTCERSTTARATNPPEPTSAA